MEKWKQILQKMLYPPVFLVVLVSLSFPAIVFVLTGGYEAAWFAYPLYVLSAYALTVVSARLVPLLLRWSKKRKAAAAAEASLSPEQRLHNLSLGLFKDLAMNLGFGLFYLVSGFFQNSPWLMVNGIYNLVQGFAYGVLIPYQRTLEKQYEPYKAWRGYTAMGWWLMAVNLTMTGCVFLVVWRGETESYSGILVFAVAAMTFYKLVMSILSLIRFRRSSSPILGAACNAGHTEAIMSLFMLQTALLSAFGQGFPHTKLMNTLTGTGVCLLTIAGAAGMVYHGRKKQKAMVERNGK